MRGRCLFSSLGARGASVGGGRGGRPASGGGKKVTLFEQKVRGECVAGKNRKVELFETGKGGEAGQTTVRL